MTYSPPPDEEISARRRAIGDQIRAARIYANLTQETVAHRAGITLANYNRIEQAHAAAGIDSLIRIAHALGVPLAHLVRDE